MEGIAYVQIGFLCLVFSCTKIARHEYEADQSKKRIKFYHEFFYLPIDSGGQLKKGEHRDPFYNSSHQVTFDTAENVSEDIWYHHHDIVKSRTTYVHDAGGNLVEEKYFVETKLFRTTEYKWDNNGHKIETSTFHPDEKQNTKFIFSNDKHGNCIESAWYKFDGTLSFTQKFKYDENNHKIEQRDFKSTGELGRLFVFKYDNSGNLIEEENYDGEDQFVYRHVYKYDKSTKIEEYGFWEPNRVVDYSTQYSIDEFGNITKEFNTGSRNYLMEYKYEYDRNNNWVKKVEYRNGEPELIVEREIAYF